MSDEPRIKIYYNKNLGMSPGKLAAQAVHSALMLLGVHPGYPVVVLAANKGRVASQSAVVIDEGRTEIPPNSTTAGASYEFPVGTKANRAVLEYLEAWQARENAEIAFEKAKAKFLEYADNDYLELESEND